MQKNSDHRMKEFIQGMLSRENFNLYIAPTNDQGSSFIIRNILADKRPQYIEVQCLSRTEEYKINIEIPITIHNHFYFFILYSPGMGKIWLLREDELIHLRNKGLDQRDTSPYLVTSFERLKNPELRLEEFKNK
ncbi:MAG: hypothetical protein ACRCWI_01425 [Brevinema sp.]